MSSSFYMILDMLVAMADLGYGGPKPFWALIGPDRTRRLTHEHARDEEINKETYS